MSTLYDAAFGANPQRWPLPVARTDRDRWWRAVAAGGQGYYAVADAELDALVAAEGGPLRSLALSTRASFLRQLGHHAAARGWDGRALHAAREPEARADALVGLAADALGTGRFALSHRLLERAHAAVEEGDAPRVPVRFAWVSAELAMATGAGAAAVAHAERAVDLAAHLGSARHAVKSNVVLAAAACAAGDIARARTVADDAVCAAQDLGLIPLTWALACLLSGVGSAVAEPAEVAALRDRAAAVVRERGGVWSNR